MGNYTNYDEWENNLNLSIKNYTGEINSDFLFGYYAHVITDIACSEKLWNPVRLTNNEKYIKNFAKDCYEIDSRLLEGLENKEIIWSLLKNSTNYCLPGVFNVGDLSILIDEMITNMYNKRKPSRYYKFKVITFTDMLDFIDITTSKINNSQFRLQA